VHSHRRSHWLPLVVSVLLSMPNLVRAQTWSLSLDFSSVNNPGGVWTYGSKTTLDGPLDLYTNNTTIPINYNTQQLAGWAFSTTDVVPCVLKNISSADWVFDGTANGGGRGILKPGDVLLHPSSLSGRFSVARWTAPKSGRYRMSAQFARFENVQGGNSSYSVLSNGTPLAGGSGMLVGFGGSDSFATYFSGPLNLRQGDAIEFAVGFGTDGTSDADGTTVRASFSFTARPAPAANLPVRPTPARTTVTRTAPSHRVAIRHPAAKPVTRTPARRTTPAASAPVKRIHNKKIAPKP
jgi:hypothetical protein